MWFEILRICSEEVIAAGILHDTLEDTEYASIVKALSPREKELKMISG